MENTLTKNDFTLENALAEALGVVADIKAEIAERDVLKPLRDMMEAVSAVPEDMRETVRMALWEKHEADNKPSGKSLEDFVAKKIETSTCKAVMAYLNGEDIKAMSASTSIPQYIKQVMSGLHELGMLNQNGVDAFASII